MSPGIEQLAAQQALMLAALFDRERPHGLAIALPAENLANNLAQSQAQVARMQRGIDVYRANAGALAERCLSSTYPVLAQLIGMESFGPLARYFWQMFPPQRGDMAQWGQALPQFLAAAPQLAAEPFLADVARVEWALHSAATAADAALDAASFALLATSDTAATTQGTTLKICPGCVLLHSAYPVATLVNAHLSGVPSLQAAAHMLASGMAETALVWRDGFKPRVRAVASSEAVFISCLLVGQRLETALQAACDAGAGAGAGAGAQFDFNTWLGDAVRSALVTGAVAAP